MSSTLNETRISYLYEAVRTGTVRAAADALDIAPSAVSRQISLLEQELAVPLIERHKRGVSPTQAGELLLEYFREQRSHQSDVLAKLQEIRGLRRGSINLVMGEGFISDMISGPIKQFCKKYPEISLVINLAGTNEVVSAVAADEAEIGLVFSPPVEQKIVSRAIVRQPMYAIVGKEFPLLGKVESVTLKDLSSYPMALTHLAYGTRQLVEAAMLIEKVRLTPTITTNSIAAPVRRHGRTGQSRAVCHPGAQHAIGALGGASDYPHRAQAIDRSRPSAATFKHAHECISELIDVTLPGKTKDQRPLVSGRARAGQFTRLCARVRCHCSALPKQVLTPWTKPSRCAQQARLLRSQQELRSRLRADIRLPTSPPLPWQCCCRGRWSRYGPYP
jgi:DNA-binding transcriptional LysR family regulator